MKERRGRREGVGWGGRAGERPTDRPTDRQRDRDRETERHNCYVRIIMSLLLKNCV